MTFPPNHSPHIHDQSSVEGTMLLVLWALVPGVLLYIGMFGWGVLVQILLAISFAMALEALCLWLRGARGAALRTDYSSVVAATLFAVSIPPTAPWWFTLAGMLFAIVVIKQIYGGLGHNLFNPAMAAYVFMLLFFPTQFVHWPSGETGNSPNIAWYLNMVFGDGDRIDQYSGATVLTHMQLQLSNMGMLSEIGKEHGMYGLLGGSRWEWINLAFACGGIFLLAKRIIDWRVPLSLLGSVFLLSGMLHASNADLHASPWFHLFSGGTLLCAFFIATEPVSGAITPLGRWCYGAGIGVLLVLIRSFGDFADGVAFAVLMMNCAAPLLDHFLAPEPKRHQA